MTNEEVCGATPRSGKVNYMEVMKKIDEKLRERGYSYYNDSKYDNPLPKLNNICLNCSDSVEEHMNKKELIILHNVMSMHLGTMDLTDAQKARGKQKLAEIRELIHAMG